MTVIQKDQARFVETIIDDETVVMSLANGSFYSMQGTAGQIWQLLDGPGSRESIIETFAEEYGMSPAEIAPGVDDFISQLQSAGLLKQA